MLFRQCLGNEAGSIKHAFYHLKHGFHERVWFTKSGFLTDQRLQSKVANFTDRPSPTERNCRNVFGILIMIEVSFLPVSIADMRLTEIIFYFHGN